MISRQSLKQYFWNLFVNGFIMSYIIPSRLRILWLNLLGCKISGVICGKCIILSPKIKLGHHSYINRECIIDNAEEFIIIGNNCSIACRVSIHTTNHDYSNCNRRGGKCVAKSIVIDDGCWIGSNVIILPGSFIGKGCVISAGSVVKGKLENNGLYAGNPAQLIKKLNA